MAFKRLELKDESLGCFQSPKSSEEVKLAYHQVHVTEQISELSKAITDKESTLTTLKLEYDTQVNKTKVIQKFMDESKKELSVLMRNMLRNVQSAKRDKVVIGKHSIVNNTSSETIVIPDSEAPEDQEACVEDDGGRGGGQD